MSSFSDNWLTSAIQSGESRTLEFKAELPKDSRKWTKTIVAFANGAGGKLIIGINNKRVVTGIPHTMDIFELRDKISDTIGEMCSPQIIPDISLMNINGKQILVVEVYPGSDTPYYITAEGLERGTYIRLDATTRNADDSMLQELELRSKKRFYDELPFPSLSVERKDLEKLCEIYLYGQSMR